MSLFVKGKCWEEKEQNATKQRSQKNKIQISLEDKMSNDSHDFSTDYVK